MKSVVNEYTVKNRDLNNSLRIANISDIHSNIQVLKYLVWVLKQLNPDIVTISGDTIDSVDDCTDDMYKTLLELCEYFKTYISIGNHDTVRYTEINGKRSEIDTNDYEFFEKLRKQGVNVIYNTNGFLQATDDVNIYAVNPPVAWYQQGENIHEFTELMQQYDFAKNKFNLLLSHTPNGFICNNSLICDSNIDLILSGHNHSGLTPWFIQKHSKQNIGFVGPYGKVLFKNAYGVYSNKDSSLIISNGVTKIANSNEVSFLADLVNGCFVPEIDIINLEPANENNVILNKRHILK